MVPGMTSSAHKPVAAAAAAAKPDSLIRKDDGLAYWRNATPDVDGMLGGVPAIFGPISRVDLQGSRTFLARLGIGSGSRSRKVSNCLEGGAGIGRITHGLLVNVAEHVDVVEPIAKFTDALRGKKGVRRVFNMGLEDWRGGDDDDDDDDGDDDDDDDDDDGTTRYDLVWTQWCLGHLTDEQLRCFLERCREALVPGTGVIVVKENLSTSGVDVFDPVDSCVTRHEETWKSIFQQAGLRIVKEEPQRGLPETGKARLLPVMMYALQP